MNCIQHLHFIERIATYSRKVILGQDLEPDFWSLRGFNPIWGEELAPGSGVDHGDVSTERPCLCGGVEPASEPPVPAPMTSEVSDGFSDKPNYSIASTVECSWSLQPLVSSDPEKMEAVVASVSLAVGKASGKTDRKPSLSTGWSMVSVEPSAAALVSLAVEQAPIKTDRMPSPAGISWFENCSIFA